MTASVRILYDIHPSVLGGTERFLDRFVRSLDRSRFEPVVLSVRRGAPLQLIASAGVRTFVVSDGDRTVDRVTALIRRERIDLVQSNYYASALAVAASRAEVPHIWRLGGHVALGSGTRTAGEARSLLELIDLLSACIICNSRYVAGQFGRRACPEIEVIANGVTAWPQRPARKPGPWRIGMVAHLTPQKRHADFLEAADRICAARDDVVFELVGGAYRRAAGVRDADAIRRLARPLARAGRLTLTSVIGAEEHVPRHFDLFVLPSIGESCSNALLEAMSAGLPIVAARSGGHPELVTHGRTGLLVPPASPGELARAILRLLDDPRLAARLGRQARQEARTRFSMRACVRRYEAAYRRVTRTDSRERQRAGSSRIAARRL